MGSMISEEDLIGHINVILQDMRPNIQMDGGDIEFVFFRDGVVGIRLSGTCNNCCSSQDSVRADIESRLKDVVNDVREVVVIDDR